MLCLCAQTHGVVLSSQQAIPVHSTTRSAPATMTASPEDDLNLALLHRRIGEMKSVNRPHSVVLREVLLPGQRMRVSLMSEELSEVLRGHSTIGVVGTRSEDTGATPSADVALLHGVEANITDLRREFNDAGYGDACRWSATLIGGRIFELADPPLLKLGDVFQTDVRWLDLGLADQLSAARSPSRAVDLAARELGSLVETWLDLVRGGGSTLWGRPRAAEPVSSGDAGEQPEIEEIEEALGRMLSDLGELPGIEQPSERALWVAALINPCGADRLAWPVVDVRPSVLTATTPMERLSVAKMGLVDSIYKLKGGKWPMNTYYW